MSKYEYKGNTKTDKTVIDEGGNTVSQQQEISVDWVEEVDGKIEVNKGVFTIKDLRKAFNRGVYCGVYDAPEKLEDRHLHWHRTEFNKFFKKYYH